MEYLNYQLMIGNYLYYFDDDNTIIVKVLDIDNVSLNVKDLNGNRFFCHEMKRFKEIPISEELLISMGAVKTWFGYEYKSLNISNDFRLMNDCGEYYLTNEIKSVHRLQNIYFNLYEDYLPLSF